MCTFPQKQKGNTIPDKQNTYNPKPNESSSQ